MEDAHIHCILCGSQKRELLIEIDNWRIVKCTQCGLGVLDPMPSSEELKELYNRQYFSEHYDNGLKIGSQTFERRIKSEGHRINFFKRLKRKGRVLDIGCGHGNFLYACRLFGYNVQGIEVSEWAHRYASEELKLPVALNDIKDIHFENNSFDVITMWHFLEHTFDPSIYLKKASEWLRRDGILVVDVPNYKGTDAIKTWHTWQGWSVPFHLYHFTPETLERILVKFGFRPVKSKDYLSEYVKDKIDKSFRISFFSRFIASFFSGHSIAIASRPLSPDSK
jgi:2-polyprenyl-3-methyl-5-hydroxy-6-metoxy-1,4-benzoquinol methylase